MPNKKMIIGDSSWLNFMREIKQKFPELEHISRQLFYPFASKYYQIWKKNFKNVHKDELKSIKKFVLMYVK
jgi:hypothetical protein